MKIKSILLSQPKPVDVAKTPYEAIIKKHNVNIEFEKFIKLEDVSASELRQDKIKLNDTTLLLPSPARHFSLSSCYRPVLI